MKKVLAICLTSLMLLSTTSCGEQKVPTPTEVEVSVATTTTTLLTTTTRAPEPTLPIPKSAPKGYLPVLQELQRMIENSGQYTDEFGNLVDYEYQLDGGWGIYGGTQSLAGYAIQDINRDGIPELIIMTRNGFISAVFTISDGKPLQLGAYGNRYGCTIGKDGMIYTHGSSGAMDSNNEVWILKRGATKLELLSVVGVRTDHDPGAKLPYEFYKVVDGKESIISEKERDELVAKYPEFHYYDLEFVPLGIRVPVF
jgi:hypothetical protein